MHLGGCIFTDKWEAVKFQLKEHIKILVLSNEHISSLSNEHLSKESLL